LAGRIFKEYRRQEIGGRRGGWRVEAGRRMLNAKCKMLETGN
jgi:hypothetical protein